MAKKPKVRKLVYEEDVLDMLRETKEQLKADLRRSLRDKCYDDAAKAGCDIDMLETLMWRIVVLKELEGQNG